MSKSTVLSGGAVDDLTKGKEKKRDPLTVAGVVLLIVGIVVCVVGFVIYMGALKDPSLEAVATVVTEYPSLTGNATLEEGNYDIWYDPGFIGFGDPGDVEVFDTHGQRIFDSPDFGGIESITVNGENYEKKGTFQAKESGNYTFDTAFSGTLLITPHLDFGYGLMIFYIFLVVAIMGAIILIGAAALHYKKKRYAFLQQGPQPLTGPQVSPVPHQPTGPVYPCPSCGWALRFIGPYQKWYCDSCRKYF
jgi:hypothetical protein